MMLNPFTGGDVVVHGKFLKCNHVYDYRVDESRLFFWNCVHEV